MVRCGGRSRGCMACRKRKIKCDESQPVCSQCRRTRRECSGAIVGPVFLKVDPRGSPRKQRRSEPQTQKRLCQLVLGPSGGGGGGGSDSSIAGHPNSGSVLCEEQLVASLAGFFGRCAANKTRDTSWLTLCCREALTQSPVNNEHMHTSVLAAALALHGIKANNPAALAESRRWYLRGIQHQRSKVQVWSSEPRPTVTVHDVALPIILGYYEALLPTSSKAWDQHITAAATLLQLAGPEACQKGWFRQLFLSVRIHMVSVSLRQWTPSIIATDEWINVPYRQIPKGPLDRVVDLLLKLPCILGPSATDSAQDQTSLLWIIRNLSDLWDTILQFYPHLRAGDCPDTIQPAGMAAYVIGTTEFLEPPAAITIAFYSLAWITVLARLPQGLSYEQLITAHCNAILTAAAYIGSIKDGCSCIRLIYSLQKVISCSPSERQAREAESYIHNWGLLQTFQTHGG
ncbi:hypothetical protein ASPZODRAFT_127339 [Penicilliopsis zonata CBS 506.65]|uniref:Zn(2)-C6 fungal-type domain-containing protein n=1 Tax=Penicilliopsis zonata CBS 506.65 TaxID=1073090 RepID=A0A1L9SW50_9EURO|nr:hypothetical protein ASPZODRAFT_127339 [Penicilliopsis zonata CBS 506.65]OJJ51283.1 hypothetical protein ASPZODRAFT_127339 [Penicilliopsis zonata CBS 506.65]